MSEAAALQDDLRCAPFAWVVNRSLAALQALTALRALSAPVSSA